MSPAIKLCVFVTVCLATVVSGFPNIEKPTDDESFQTILEKWSVSKTVNDDTSFEFSEDEHNDVADLPLLPSTFQSTIFHTVGNRVLEAVRYAYDYPNQRIASYGFKFGNSTASNILLCNARLECTFNATWCRCWRNVACNISRNWLPPFARYSASFRLGQSTTGIPVYQWTIGSQPETTIIVLTQSNTGAPVQIVYPTRAAADIQDFTDLKLNVDPRLFYIPPQCHKYDTEVSPTFKDFARNKL